jgi:hypothetical protein
VEGKGNFLLLEGMKNGTVLRQVIKEIMDSKRGRWE